MNSNEARAAIDAAQTELTKLSGHTEELDAAWKVAAQGGDEAKCDEVENLQQQLKRKIVRQEFLRDEATTALAAALAAEETTRREVARSAGVVALKAAGKHSQAVEKLLAQLGEALASYQGAIGEAAQAARGYTGNSLVQGVNAFQCATLVMQHEAENRRRLAEGLNIDTHDFAYFVADAHASIGGALEAAR